VPSPPSATGNAIASAPASRAPRTIAAAAAAALRVPLKAFGAQTASWRLRRIRDAENGTGWSTHCMVRNRRLQTAITMCP
jgi:hypothetical protein